MTEKLPTVTSVEPELLRELAARPTMAEIVQRVEALAHAEPHAAPAARPVIAVVDTSALIDLFTVDAHELDASLADRLSHVIPHVPDIIDVEFHHALRSLLQGSKISSSRAEQARALFADTPKIRFPSADLMQRIWSLRHNLGAYDACFIALAESLEVPLITCDGKQVGAGGHQAMIEAFSPQQLAGPAQPSFRFLLSLDESYSRPVTIRNPHTGRCAIHAALSTTFRQLALAVEQGWQLMVAGPRRVAD